MRLQAVPDAAEPASAHAAGVARMLRDTARAWNLVWRADVQPPQALPDKISRYDGVSTSPLPLTARPHSMDPQALPRPVLLVVDDEPDLRDLLGEYFTRHGFEVREAADAARARACVAESVPDVAILDVNMPGENGLSLARWLRDSHPGLGIVMLTTVGEAVDRVVGLELGADDYLPKPFEVRELLARVRAVLRRAGLAEAVSPRAAVDAAPAAPRRERFGQCTLDLDGRRLFDADGAEIEISAAEYDLLALFARHPNRPLNRDQIMEQAHHRDWDVFDRSIDLRVMRLRRKIERNPDKPEVIKTVRNVGYVFVP
jgi:DNA-binding response OmpR family regulator